MIILTDTSGLTIKEIIQENDHVRINETGMSFWVNDERQRVTTLDKPYVELTLNDFQDALDEMRELQILLATTYKKVWFSS